MGGDASLALEVEYYPTPPGAIAEAAAQVTNQAASIEGLKASFTREHRGVVSAVEGDLVSPTLLLSDGSLQNYTAIHRTGIWAVGCLMEFAAAVHEFNATHTSPRCVKQLLRAYHEAAADNFGVTDDAGRDGPKSDTDSGPSLGALIAARNEVVHELNAEYHRLEGWLDDRAGQVSRKLASGPNGVDVRQMWASGLLPPYTPLAFPELNLPGEGLARLRFDDPGWDLTDNLSLDTPDGLECAANGWIRGPDGNWYRLEIPEYPELDCDSPYGCFTNPYGEGQGVPYEEGWYTIHSRTGEIAIGDAPGWDDAFAFAVSGAQVYGPRSIGDDQTQYVVMDPETGAVDLRSGIDPAAEPYEPQPDGYDNPYHPSQQPGIDRVGRTGTVLDLGVRGLETVNNMDTVEDGRHYAYQVVFQESEDGERRAVVVLNQARYDENTGKPEVDQNFGQIGPDGELEARRD